MWVDACEYPAGQDGPFSQALSGLEQTRDQLAVAGPPCLGAGGLLVVAISASDSNACSARSRPSDKPNRDCFNPPLQHPIRPALGATLPDPCPNRGGLRPVGHLLSDSA